MITRVAIQNYRIFESFDLELHSGMNILVGDNDCGKSTLLEAVGLALTGRIRGKLLAQELSPYLFNDNATNRYLTALRSAQPVEPPEIIIDLFLEKELASPLLKGTNNLRSEDAYGVRIRVSLDPDYQAEYDELIKDPAQLKLVPIEYYRVEWLGFSGNGVTFRSIPATAHLIDASSIGLKSGTDYYLQGLINSNLETGERVELSRTYRMLKETFTDDPKIAAINKKLSDERGSITERELSLSLDISQKSTWESAIVPHLDNFPISYIGKGEQSTLKILLALNRRLANAQILLIEEPENHVSFSTMNILVRKIAEKCDGKQVLLTTHSSYVLNKLGLDNLVLMKPDRSIRMADLPPDTVEYFEKLSGFDTLRVVLTKSSFLVEGPSDELVVQRAYLDRHGILPIEHGIDVIDSRGLTAKRILDIAVRLNCQVTVITDNDGEDPSTVMTRFAAYTAHPNVKVHVGKDRRHRSLEPQICAVNDTALLNSILDTSFQSEEELSEYMSKSKNKTACALAIFKSNQRIAMPEYITDAIK